MTDRVGIIASASLTPALAQEIASETSAIVGFNVIITDADGIVLGSGDLDRVGTFHEASLEVVASREPATHSAEQARRLTGVRPGVTLPILVGGQPVGAVGITGRPSQVRRFGLMVERQTEMMLQQASLLHSSLRRERLLEDVVREATLFDPQLTDAASLIDRARELYVDLTVPRVALVVRVLSRSGDTPVRSEFVPNTVLLLREVFHTRGSVAVAAGNGRYTVLCPLRGREVSDVTATAEACVALFATRLSAEVAIGLGSPARGLGELPISYEDAGHALRLGLRTAGARVTRIDEVRAAQLLEGVAPRTRQRYADAVTATLRGQHDWPTLRDTVVAWCESGFSLVQASRRLGVHRNTLVFRLEKIERLLGWSERAPRRYLDLYLACVISTLDEPGSPADMA